MNIFRRIHFIKRQGLLSEDNRFFEKKNNKTKQTRYDNIASHSL